MEHANEFMIHLSSVHDVEEFVGISTGKNFSVFLDDGQHRVNGKSFMEMFCLVITRPLRVTAECSSEEFQEFCKQIEHFRLN